ncbi:ATP-dependent 6-phosphofructokinase [Vanrija pseudolonga]|uniref:ATP-dependent 6-phosphofructokinase n=1 Tax=Vanrija pseudolonga TaxID=143232 RepID=A0AAF1BHW0_9TREE|nr:ATP-dependent 6-phosphofructokinase [Vanrija pseudolonga]
MPHQHLNLTESETNNTASAAAAPESEPMTPAPVVHHAVVGVVPPSEASEVGYDAAPVSQPHPKARAKRTRKIAVLTSGGDSAGMNAAVRAVVRQGIARGCETYIIREGWEGLVRGNATEPTPAVSRRPSAAPSPAFGPKSVGFAGLSALDLGARAHPAPSAPESHTAADPKAIAPLSDAPLSFGYGGLLRDGAGEGDPDEVAAAFAGHETIDTEEDDGGKTLKGRYIVRVGWDDVRGWLGEGGTLIGSSRCPSFRTREGRLKAAHNLIRYGIDCLAVCGGDGSLTGADKLRGEWPSLLAELHSNGDIDDEQLEAYRYLNIVGLVGSIDNDMSMTDLTIGADTALHRICEAVDSISSTASSHSRAFVIEVMGRHCGWLALMAGVATGADFIFIPEHPPTSDNWEKEMCDVLHQHRRIGKRKSIVIVAEGALDRNLKPIKADHVKQVLVEQLGLDTRVTTLGHTQRGGTPSAFDRILPTLQGVKAVEALLEATPETPSYMIGIQENKITKVPLLEAVAKTQAVAAAIESQDFALAMSYRDSEFRDMLEAFQVSSSLKTTDHLPENQRLRVGIIHVGAPAGGMNAATRQAVRYCHNRGHVPVAIYNGFDGLLEDNVAELSWLRVDNWNTRGGSELGTNRTLPTIDLGGVAAALQRHAIDALLLIGGFEAYSSILSLDTARKDYPSLHIPMIHLPATLSNNVPLTDFSLGSDTSLNALVLACDAIKQSASASRNRVFVVETQGGMSGYIATLGALAVGAVLLYTPEEGVSLRRLLDDVDFLKERYALDERGKSEGRLVIKSEKASSVYTTEFITKIFKEEGQELFDARSAQLGHTLQGGVPSPLDRCRAARLSLLSMQFLEKHAHPNSQAFHGRRKPGSDAAPETAVMIAIQRSKIVFASMDNVQRHSDMRLRRGTDVWWSGIKHLAEVMGGRAGLVQDSHGQRFSRM